MFRQLLSSKTLFILALLACLALPLGHLTAQDAAPAWNYTRISEVEPNNTAAQANPVVIDARIAGHVGDSDAVDYFKFAGHTGDRIAVVDDYLEFNLPPTLWRLNGTELALEGDARWATLPGDGNYTLAASSKTGVSTSYTVYLVRLPANEPNETMATAIPVTIGQTVTVVRDYPCDIDWYRFDGRAGDVFGFTFPYGGDWPYLRDEQGDRMDEIMLPEDGVYYYVVPSHGSDNYMGEEWCEEETTLQLTVGESVWISAAADGLGGQAALKEEDIVVRKTGGGWALVFDASDVGITQDVNAIERLSDGSILLSLLKAQTVPGLGKVTPQDIIRFVPTALGNNTAGAFEWYLDGSDVGLTTKGEAIDAIDVQESVDQGLRVSLAGNGVVPRQSGGTLAVADEDIITFVQTQLGANTAGKWRMHTDGSTVPGMAAEDVNAYAVLTLVPTTALHDRMTLLVMGDAFTINGFSGGPRDLFEPYQGILLTNFADKTIDAVAIGSAMP